AAFLVRFPGPATVGANLRCLVDVARSQDHWRAVEEAARPRPGGRAVATPAGSVRLAVAPARRPAELSACTGDRVCVGNVFAAVRAAARPRRLAPDRHGRQEEAPPPAPAAPRGGKPTGLGRGPRSGRSRRMTGDRTNGREPFP